MSVTRKKLIKGLALGLGLAVIAPALGWASARGLASLGFTVIANLSPSVAQGLYLLNRNTHSAERGQLVAFSPHNAAARYGFERGWMKPGSLYIKRVGAVAGDTVCVNREVSISTPTTAGHPATYRRVGAVAATDRTGVALPHVLQGCTRVPAGHIFTIGDGLANSYDGRYYGFVPLSVIAGSITPLWARASSVGVDHE
ncbi:signal peptidase I [Xanthomonas campestris]|jgi:conjugative transfer signal peptidase TraF|uniref:signal peptidase I n=2 Tax=Xanthomonas campestris TaxID=339 RepID=UPI000E32D0C0|nr:signal peptidase I [Xanthomonas campestris]MEA9575945.1 signal peptidase I [Xanthomonas campestris]MEB2112655.1 signal peptidase I [Xanthomonas campestris pv. campestris]RFF70169.1 signal peptidase I [Xanthomonas campestris pv. campestris]